MKRPPAFTRGHQPRPPYFLKITPQIKAAEIKRLRDWAARNIRGGRRYE